MGLTYLAPLGLVLKPLVGEKHLFAGSENEFGTAFTAFQNLIVIFHTALPCPGLSSGLAAFSSESDFLGKCRTGMPGAGPTGRLVRSC